ncbi:hypothetical protein GGI12_002042 [Dipsacomyces acuminosporus]|nr:hypothetical protein GGI12_002042 [Dipsacomyces acuminosporus]
MAPQADNTAAATKRALESVETVQDGRKKLKQDTTAAETIDEQPHQACRVGRPAPSFSVPAVLADGAFGNVSLSDYKGRYLALLFYPADFTFVCPTEITSFSDHAAQFAEAGCDLAVCSTDSEFVHYNWRQQARRDGGIGEIAVPMLADRTRKLSRAYGVLCEESGQAFRGLFIIDPSQKLRIAIINDMPVGRSVAEALRLVQALKFSDEHGEVCPANWQQGEATIKPTINESKSFFAQKND